MAVANGYGLNFFRLDVAQAFVRAKFDHETYMKLNDWCGEMSGKNVRLNRSLHGSNQSGRQRAGLLVDIVVEHGKEQSRTEPCFLRMVVDGKVLLIMAVHVHDLVIAGSGETCKTSMPRWLQNFPRTTSENRLGTLATRDTRDYAQGVR